MSREWTERLTVPSTHPSLPGHFPGQPIVPGVVLLDLIGAAIQSALTPQSQIEALAYAKFLQPVTPDAPLELSIALDEGTSPRSWRARFHARLQDDVVLEGAFTLAAASVSSSDAP